MNPEESLGALEKLFRVNDRDMEYASLRESKFRRQYGQTGEQ